MKYIEKEFTLKNGQTFLLRSARKEDAPALINCLKTTSGETSFLSRESDEINITKEEEESFIQKMADEPRELMLVAFLNEELVGICSFSLISGYKRFQHRCNVGIALYQRFCGLGIGRIMMEELLKAAKDCGYEQVELEVISTNKSAIHLYESLGFEKYGILSHSMKYQDNSYADDWLMIKKFYEKFGR